MLLFKGIKTLCALQ